MINCQDFYESLNTREITFFCGVPDSLLKDFCAYISDHTASEDNIITANEGGAISLAAGYHLATGKIPLVYMQNSGEGNALNPLISLADPAVYAIPLLMVIGWRGEPGKKDEPQHFKQGEITLNLLDTLNIPYDVLSENDKEVGKILDKAVNYMQSKSAPYALVVRKKTFIPYNKQTKPLDNYKLLREDAIKSVVDCLGAKDVVVATTGHISRELFEYRGKLKGGHNKDFLTIGSMGHASSIALGIAAQSPKKNIYCLDGDGAVIMHMGALAIIGAQSVKNFRHIIFNNGAHVSVGGQPTAGFKIDFRVIAKACGYKIAVRAETTAEIKEKMLFLQKNEGPGLLEIRVSREARKDILRPTANPIDNKNIFMKFLSLNTNEE